MVNSQAEFLTQRGCWKEGRDRESCQSDGEKVGWGVQSKRNKTTFKNGDEMIWVNLSYKNK